MLGFASITNERPRKSPIGSFVIAEMLGALEVPTHASGPTCRRADWARRAPGFLMAPLSGVDVPGVGCQCL